MIWKAILESKERGAKIFDIGKTIYTNENDKVSKKERNIAYFKEGFGGNLIFNNHIEIKD